MFLNKTFNPTVGQTDHINTVLQLYKFANVCIVKKVTSMAVENFANTHKSLVKIVKIDHFSKEINTLAKNFQKINYLDIDHSTLREKSIHFILYKTKFLDNKGKENSHYPYSKMYMKYWIQTKHKLTTNGPIYSSEGYTGFVSNSILMPWPIHL